MKKVPCVLFESALLVLFLSAFLAGCTEPKAENEDTSDSLGDDRADRLAIAWDSLEFSNQTNDFYHTLSVDIVRCIRSNPSSCENSFLTNKTHFGTVIGGDQPQSLGRYPDDMAHIAASWASFDRYEFASHVVMPVPIDPRAPYYANITLISSDGSQRQPITFHYEDGRLVTVSVIQYEAITGRL